MRRDSTPARLLVVTTLAAVALAGCGSSDGDGDVKVAQARVTQKEKALADAQAGLTAASGAFCQASADYVAALDRYGDVLHATAPTVGDVKDAGRDLAQPREEAVAGAQAAVDAQAAVVTAQQELAEAKAALTAAKASGSPAPSATPPKSPKPLAPEATVTRVKQAETDLATAQQGISDATPLVQAAQQFNAAAVAVEMSWLQLFADAGCLTDDQEKQAADAVRGYTKALQSALKDAGYYDGEVDGVYGPATVEAVEKVQQAHGLPVTGTLDKATAAALEGDLVAKGGAVARQATASTAALQQTLTLVGYWDGPVDGKWTPALTEALTEFQTDLGVKPTGTVDAATISAFEKALKELTAPPSPAPSETSGTPEATDSAAPSESSS